MAETTAGKEGVAEGEEEAEEAEEEEEAAAEEVDGEGVAEAEAETVEEEAEAAEEVEEVEEVEDAAFGCFRPRRAPPLVISPRTAPPRAPPRIASIRWLSPLVAAVRCFLPFCPVACWLAPLSAGCGWSEAREVHSSAYGRPG